MSYDYQRISSRIDRGVLFATIDNPPINLMNWELYRELIGFVKEVEGDDEVRVLVLESANPDFFLAHFDVEILLQQPIDQPARYQARNVYHEMCERLRTMPKATIAKIAGRVGGGGIELATSCDMRFGALGHTRIVQMEVGLGVLPGGTGTQLLPRLIGRSRALEVILGGDEIDAETAERWGYLNRALPSDELDDFVSRLALRIASFSPEAVARAKRSVLNAERMPLPEGLREEAYMFEQGMRTDTAQRLMKRFVEQGGQTPASAVRVAEVVAEVVGVDADSA